jgi:hypothetical protein
VTPITQNAKAVPAMLPAAPVQDLSVAEGSTSAERASARDQGHRPAPLFGLTPLASAFRYIEPTWRNYISYVDMEARAGNVEAQYFIKIWQSLPYKERISHVPEQLCDLAKVPAADLVAWVTKQVWQENQAATSMVLSFNRARVLERTAEFAMADPDNGRHAELFLKAAALLPSGGGRGATPISIYNMPVASSGSVALAGAGAKSDSSPVGASGLRSMDDDIVGLSHIMRDEGAPVIARAEDIDDDPDDDERDDDPEDDDDGD